MSILSVKITKAIKKIAKVTYVTKKKLLDEKEN